jgi:hypothetical protein
MSRDGKRGKESKDKDMQMKERRKAKQSMRFA